MSNAQSINTESNINLFASEIVRLKEVYARATATMDGELCGRVINSYRDLCEVIATLGLDWALINAAVKAS